jgi:hypothetical protein
LVTKQRQVLPQGSIDKLLKLGLPESGHPGRWLNFTWLLPFVALAVIGRAFARSGQVRP